MKLCLLVFFHLKKTTTKPNQTKHTHTQNQPTNKKNKTETNPLPFYQGNPGKNVPVGDSSDYRYFTTSIRTVYPPTPFTFMRLLTNHKIAIPAIPAAARETVARWQGHTSSEFAKELSFHNIFFSDLLFLLKVAQGRIQRNGLMLFKYISEVLFTFCQ